jgi:hypothetical protein
MHRHLTALRRANLSNGVVIQESEHGSPWADSMTVVRDCAGEILKVLEPDEVLSSKQSASLLSFRDYLSIHGERLAFDLDYMRELVEAGERVLEIGALPFMLTLPLMRRGYRGGSATAAPATPVPRPRGPDIPTHSAASARLSAKRDVG